MKLAYTVRPISDRSAFTGHPERSPFRAKWVDTLLILERELDALAARHVVLEVDVREGQIRMDGQLRADATTSSPAVRVAFDSKHGPLVYATDRYGADWTGAPLAKGWQENVRAIALGLEALRKVDRYGISRRGEQYRGYKAIGGGADAVPAAMSRVDAAATIAEYAVAARVARPGESLSQTFKRVRAAYHPDRVGDRRVWDEIDRAAQVLGLS